MKKRIVKFINFIDYFSALLKETYNEVYSEYECTNLEEEFKCRVESIQRKNKNKFIKRLSALATAKCLNDTGVQLPEQVALSFAEDMFLEAKRKGELDELNKLKPSNKPPWS